jgi:hypothetical protein
MPSAEGHPECVYTVGQVRRRSSTGDGSTGRRPSLRGGERRYRDGSVSPLPPAEADKRIVDLSGDGTNNAGRDVNEARDQAVAAGVTINALAIINTRTNLAYAIHTQPPGGLPKYFEEHVIGGPGAFMIHVDNFDTFAAAVTR